MNPSRSPRTSACITGCSGENVCSSTRPGASARPARPATWCSNCTVRSAARRSPPARPRSASTTPTNVRCGKCQPLATIWVPMIRSTSRAAIAREASAAACGPGIVSLAITRRRASGNSDAASSVMRSTPGPTGGQAVGGTAGGAFLRDRHGVAAMVALQFAAGCGAPPARRCSSGIACGGRNAGTASAAHSRGGSGTASPARPAPASRAPPRSAAAPGSGPAPAASPACRSPRRAASDAPACRTGSVSRA